MGDTIPGENPRPFEGGEEMTYQTRILKPGEYAWAALLIRQGQCVAFPTETVYGLGANALDSSAVKKVFLAKGRPADNPLIVHCHDLEQVDEVVGPWPKEVQILMDAFWPGPLTLVLQKRPVIPSAVTGSLTTVAVRIPNHPIALDLIRTANLPIAAPSANTSGRPSPTRAEHVWQDMAGKIPAIIDGGPTGWGLESTVLDCTVSPFRLLRPGGTTLEQLTEYVSVETSSDHELTGTPPSPGMKYKHYSPDAQVILVAGNNIQETVQEQIIRFNKLGLKVAVMAFTETMSSYTGTCVLEMGSNKDLHGVAAKIYHLLRETDKLGCDLVLIEGLPERELGAAIMNRLSKAASGRIIYS